MPTNADTSLDSPEDQQGQQYPMLSRTLSVRSNNGALALRERALSDREMISERSLAIRAQEQELEKVKQLSALMQQEQRIRDTMEKQRHIMRATKALGDISADDPQWEKKLAATISENPLASSDEFVQKKVGFLYDHQKAKDAAALKLSQLQSEEDIRTNAAVDREKKLMEPRADTAGKEAEKRVAAQTSPEAIQGKVNEKTALEGVKKQDSMDAFAKEIEEYGLTADAFENPEAWKRRDDGQMFVKNGPSSFVTMTPGRLKQLQDRYSSLVGSPVKPQASASAASTATPGQPVAVAAPKPKLKDIFTP